MPVGQVASASVGKFLTDDESRSLQESVKNYMWIYKNHRKLLKQYPDSWIAVKDQSVVETGYHYESFLSMLKRKYDFGPTELAITYIDSKPPMAGAPSVTVGYVGG